jgi:hypothetical protein
MKKADSLCPFCSSSLSKPAGDTPEGYMIGECPDCKTIYHQSCWNEEHGCSSLGCPQAGGACTTRAPAQLINLRRIGVEPVFKPESDYVYPVERQLANPSPGYSGQRQKGYQKIGWLFLLFLILFFGGRAFWLSSGIPRIPNITIPGAAKNAATPGGTTIPESTSFPARSVENTSPSTNWIVQTIDTKNHQGGVGFYTSLAFNSKDIPYIAYFDDAQDSLNIARLTDSGWLVERFWNNHVIDGMFPTVITGQLDYPILVYSAYGIQKIAYMKFDGKKWSAPQYLISLPDKVGGLSSILDKKGQTHFIYSNRMTGEIFYATNKKSPRLIDQSSPVDNYRNRTYIPLVLNNQGNPSTCYAGQSGLMYAAAPSWNPESVDSGARVGLFCSLGYDASGNPHISYYDGSKNKLLHAFREGNQWWSEIVDDGEDVGQYSSLAIGKDGIIHISYYDATQQSLKYASFSGNHWSIETVDQGNVGAYSSLALDAAGNPYIAYQDEKNQYLKFAAGNISHQPDIALRMPIRVSEVTPLVAGKWSACAGTVKSRLYYKMTAVVNSHNPSWNDLLQSHEKNSHVNSNLVAGQVIRIIDGPYCSHGYIWWKGRDQRGKQGWVSEGGPADLDYFLNPTP